MLVAVFLCFTSFTTISPSCEICGTCKAWIWSVAQRYEINSTVNSSQRRDTCRPKRSLSLKTKHYTPISDKTPTTMRLWVTSSWYLRWRRMAENLFVYSVSSNTDRRSIQDKLYFTRKINNMAPSGRSFAWRVLLIIEPWLAQRREMVVTITQHQDQKQQDSAATFFYVFEKDEAFLIT